MHLSESIHKYPRLLTVIVELLSAVMVAVSAAHFSILFLRTLWDHIPRTDVLVDRIPFGPDVIEWIDAAPRIRIFGLTEVATTWVPALLWLGLALLASLLLRNAFPAVRTSSRGMLVEFAGSWLPIPWENLQVIKVTEDISGERFVLLAQTKPRSLTFWHRFYSLIYRFGWQPGFLITSNISDFEPLLKTMIGESERTSRAIENARPVRMQENASSPLFSLLLSPGSFFSRRSAAESSPTSTAQPYNPANPVHATYPARISTLLSGAALVLAIFAGWRYLSYWVRFLALELPFVRRIPPFSWSFTDPTYIELFNAYRTNSVPFFGIPGRPDLPAPWWMLLAAHMMILLAFLAITWLRNLLPSVEARSDGLAVRDMLRPRWQVIPWGKVEALKLTEFSEESQILLLQAPSLPLSQRLTSWLYDRSFSPGVLITSAISNFQPMLQHVLTYLTPIEQAQAQANRPPILRQEARSPLLWLAFGQQAARDDLVSDARENPATRKISTPELLRAGGIMAVLALPPAFLVLVNGMLGDSPPGFGLIFGVIGIWIFGMLEWPLVSLLSVLLDDSSGGGEEGYRAFYVYPESQLPRLLPMIAAVILLIVGLPVLPVLAWVGAIAWAYWLSAGLWLALYEWRGSQVILGGILPAFWQLLLLIGFLISSR